MKRKRDALRSVLLVYCQKYIKVIFLVFIDLELSEYHGYDQDIMVKVYL